MNTEVFENDTPVGSPVQPSVYREDWAPRLSHSDVSSLVYDATGDDWKCLSFDRTMMKLSPRIRLSSVISTQNVSSSNDRSVFLYPVENDDTLMSLLS